MSWFIYLIMNSFICWFIYLSIYFVFFICLFYLILFIYITRSIICTVSAEADAIPRVSFKWLRQNSFKQIGIENEVHQSKAKTKGCYWLLQYPV